MRSVEDTAVTGVMLGSPLAGQMDIYPPEPAQSDQQIADLRASIESSWPDEPRARRT